VSSPWDESRQPTVQIRESLLKAAVLAIASFSMYFVTRTRRFGGDDTVFATVVQRWLDLGAIEPEFLHPHHLVYNPMVAGWAWLGRRVCGSVVVLDAGAAVSAAAAALAVAGVYLVLRRFEVADGISVLAAGVLAVTGGMWRYATRMEVYTLAALGVVVWLAAVADKECTWRRLAGGFAGPWLGHSVLGLLVLPGVWRQRRRPPVVFRAVVAGIVIPGAIAAAALVWLNHAYSVDRLAEVMGGGGLSTWLSAPDPAAAVRAVYGLAVWRTYHQIPVYPHSVMVLFDVLGQVAAIALAGLVILGAVRGSMKLHPLASTAVAGIAILIPLWLVWDVGNPEHVVAAAPLFAVLAALGASSLPRPWAGTALVISASGLLLANGLGSALLETQPQLSRTRVVAEHVRETVPENGVLVAVGVDPELRLGVPYLASRRVIDLTKFVSSADRFDTSPDEALVQWWAAVAAAAAAGRDLWLLEDLDDPAVAAWIAKIGISEGAWRRVRAALHVGGGSTLSADGLVVRRPVTLRRLEVG
jgi:hypothetical protein